MEISKLNSTIHTELATSKNKTPVTQVADAPVPAMLPQQEVSDDCRLIEAAQPQLEQLPDFDLSKVAQVRQSLIDGSFKLDLEQLAETMVQQHG
ncbi:flagellar biosynthesis anti-sigma factor FlgM [Shewanella pneumatophori]|uniref:Negative regulator of flagellin synthesis n=1 Tax=Shewanella pneumatophori TaxID=314092 RepID=A0A9X2CJF7_9GAMM|nr:flagellar biosynthesis anti-sigma factor FlgM [Shewanella pneumatophori]MCL1140464.1 flagellar biosynthesis anti-sigma factor FlgM [Shewanella pneumatophori]